MTTADLDTDGTSAAPLVLTTASDIYPAEVIERFVAEDHWQDLQVTDFLHRNATERPGETALVDAAGERTWCELDAEVRSLATGLAELDLEIGDFVGIQLPNRIEGVVTFLAVQLAGYRPLTMLPIYRDRDVAFMLQKCRARALIVPDRFRSWDYREMVERIRDSVPSLRHVFVQGEPGAFGPLAPLFREPLPAAGFKVRRLDPRGVCRVAFTSGTTASPKGVMHSHNTDMNPARWVSTVLSQDATKPILSTSPIMHVTGLIFGIYQSLMVGCKHVLQDIWDPAEALRLIETEDVFTMTAAATFLTDMVHEPSLAERDISSLKFFVQGGAPTSGTLVQLAKDKLGVSVLKTFAQSEAPVHGINRPDDPWDKILHRDGRVMPGALMKVVDPSDRTVEQPPDVPGEYATWGPHVFLGYLDDPERTAECRDAEGWFYSGDLCQIDADGYVQYVDRIKDIINRGAVKLSALEIEENIASHPAVRAAAAVPMPDPRLGEKVCAFVVLAPGTELTLPELSEHLKSRGVTPQKWPERLEIVDALPMTGTGKIRKNVLKALVADELVQGLADTADER